MNNIEYFDKLCNNFNDIKKFIIKQGKEVCNSKISKSHIKNSIDNVDFGYIHISNIANFCKNIYSFILCKKNNDGIKIDLICSRPNTKEGLELMNLVELKAKEYNIKYIYLYALNDKKLINWYIKQNFIIKDNIYDEKDGKIKLYNMEKYI